MTDGLDPHRAHGLQHRCSIFYVSYGGVVTVLRKLTNEQAGTNPHTDTAVERIAGKTRQCAMVVHSNVWKDGPGNMLQP